MTDALIEREQAAIKALLDYGQADMEGIIVTTSRQAIHEVVDALKAKDAEIEKLQDALTDHNDYLRSAYQVAVREAETPMTTRWDGCIKTWLEVLTKHHAITNDAREASLARKALGGSNND